MLIWRSIYVCVRLNSAIRSARKGSRLQPTGQKTDVRAGADPGIFVRGTLPSKKHYFDKQKKNPPHTQRRKRGGFSIHST